MLVRIGRLIARGASGDPTPRIVLSATTVAENASIGTTVGTLSVENGSGSYTFTETADPDNKFTISTANLNTSATLDYETATSHSVTIQADNGVDAPISRTFDISVVNIELALTTDATANRVYQRAHGTTSADVALAGTYAGAAGTVQARVLLASDNSEVVTWTTIDASLSGGTWSGSISTPQGGPYYVQVRTSGEPSVTVTGANQFLVGIVLVGYGQSNWLGHVTESLSPPSANAQIRQWSNGSSAWTATIEGGNGIREMMNAINNDTSIPVGLVYGGQSGVTLSALMEGAGNSYFSDLASRISASGGGAEFIVYHQGEGDGDGAAAGISSWQANLDTLHQSICDEVGRTKSQCRMVISGLSTTTSTPTDANWSAIQAKIATINAAYANIYYSHNNYDAIMLDSVHWDEASYGRSGKRYAQTINKLLGTESAFPNWSIASVAIGTATTTTVTVTHSLGTDFTPTTGITGFEVSDDNGANWETPSAAVRTNATTITLTHSSMDVSVDRLVRYQYGTEPDVTDPVLDNSSLAVPLNHSNGQTLTAEGSATLPVPTYRSVNRSPSYSSNTLTFSSMDTGPDTTGLLVIGVMTRANDTPTVSSSTVTISGHSNPTLTTHLNTSNGVIFSFEKPGGTTATIALTFSGPLFNDPNLVLYTVPIADLSSTTPVDTDSALATSATSATLNISSSSGGFIVAGARQTNAALEAASFGGDETYTERGRAVDAAGLHVHADASNTAAGTNDNTVTATYTNTAAITLVAASWR